VETPVQIFIAHHKPSQRVNDPVFVPIHVGAAAARQRLPGVLADNNGDNISEKNDSFCELTGQYWVWKNAPQSDYVGFLHYRRHLNFSGVKTHVPNEWGVIEYDRITDRYIDQNGLCTSDVLACTHEADIIVPEKWDVSAAGSNSMHDHYRRGTHHHIEDYDKAIAILLRKYPEYRADARRVNAEKAGYFTNMFVMRFDLFDAYSKWLFDILFELEKQIDINNYSVQERRVFGYISEWLFNVWISRQIRTSPSLRVKELQRTFVVETGAPESVKPAYNENNVAIVLAFDDNFVPYAGALIESIRQHVSDANNYDIVVLQEGITPRKQKLLRNIVENRRNVSIRFVDATPYFEESELPVHMHFSRAIYYRLRIPTVFSHYERVLYIDTDTIVQHDLADLYKENLNGKPIAAVKDYVMEGFRKLKVRALPECSGLPAELYLKHYVGMRDPSNYFQSGVMVFDVAALRKTDAESRVVELTNARRFWFPDQDILNAVFEGNVHYLDWRWNVLHGNGDLASFYEHLPAQTRNRYFVAHQNPLIIHYAGEKKPWLTPGIEFAEVFWKYMRETPWYELVCEKFFRASMGAMIRSEQVGIRQPEKLLATRDVIRALSYPLFPLGSKRRAIFRKIYVTLRPDRRPEGMLL
jgi:lipopolysaccharide biosynthesis glycosyltransferase